MPPLSFDKYEGLGNDFVVVEGSRSLLTRDAVRAICDRHRGVGADGVLFCGLDDGTPFMRVLNADGSPAEMCGNGLRCVALHLVRRGLVEGRAFVVDTEAGPHPCIVHEVASPGRVEVAMRAPSLAPADVPVLADAPVLDEPFDVLGVRVRLTAVSMGNPHAVIFDAPESARHEIAPLIQRDPRFPRGANVGFATMRGGRTIELRVYERGAGWTRACGTGACAAAVAAVHTGRAPSREPIAVELPGGTLDIVVGAPGERVRMIGPARHVFSGRIGP